MGERTTKMSKFIDTVDPLYHSLREAAEKCPPGGKTTVGYLHGDLVYLALFEPEPDEFWRVWHFTADTAIKLAASLIAQSEYAIVANGMSPDDAREKVSKVFGDELKSIVTEWNERATKVVKDAESGTDTPIE